MYHNELIDYHYVGSLFVISSSELVIYFSTNVPGSMN